MSKRISKAINSLYDKKTLFKIEDRDPITISNVEDNSEQEPHLDDTF